MSTRVSIAIPCRNAARWLRQCIGSALAQCGVEPEVIVVDDSSTDDSAAVARSFGSRVTVLAGEGRGAPHARNLALRHASGEWVQFLDADDFLEPEKVSTQLRDGEGADVIYSPVWIDTVRGGTTSREQSATSPEADLFTQWIRWHIPQTGGALWRREPLRALGGWREEQPCCQEHELYLRALKAGRRFCFSPAPGAVYRIWSEETLCRKDPLLVTRVRTALMDELLAWLRSTGKFAPHHAREIGRQCFEMARTQARFDLAGAAAYHAERRAKGLIHLAGPAAPWKYRAIYRLLGFAAAERLARRQR